MEEMCWEDQSSNFTLVIVVGGTRPLVTIAEVRRWLHDGYTVLGDNIMIHHFHPEDFLISFIFYDNMVWVLHDPSPHRSPFCPGVQAVVPVAYGHS
jgi:hypothetical protein